MLYINQTGKSGQLPTHTYRLVTRHSINLNKGVEKLQWNH